MTKFSDYTRIVTLITRKLTQTATPEEVKELQDWRALSGENKKLYREINQPAFWQEKAALKNKIDLAAAYRKVLLKRERRARFLLILRSGSVAALFLLSMSVSWWLFRGHQSDEKQRLPVAMNIVDAPILPGEAKAELLLADGSSVHLQGDVSDSLPQQAGTSIVTSENTLVYKGNQSLKRLVYNTLKIPRGGEYTLTLDDGTLVFLNSETELRYPVQFVGEERRVYLSGEAYFEVKPDQKRPFIVEAGKTKTEVLGTSFNLRFYEEEDRIAATLVTGKVRFMADSDKQLELLPGEQGVLSREGQLSKQEVDIRLYTAWKDGSFIFRKEGLDQVMSTVARWYNVEYYFLDPALRNVSFTGNIKRYSDFSKILEMLEMTGNIRFEVNGKNIFIKRK